MVREVVGYLFQHVADVMLPWTWGHMLHVTLFPANSPMCRAGKSSMGGMITSNLLMAAEEAHLTQGFKSRNSLKQMSSGEMENLANISALVPCWVRPLAP